MRSSRNEQYIKTLGMFAVGFFGVLLLLALNVPPVEDLQ